MVVGERVVDRIDIYSLPLGMGVVVRYDHQALVKNIRGKIDTDRPLDHNQIRVCSMKPVLRGGGGGYSL